MRVEDFSFHLPPELIAQTPLQNRSASRLLVCDGETKTWEHQQFHQIVDYLERGDCLVINSSKVIPARLIGTKEDTGAAIELLLLKEVRTNTWEVLAKPAKRVKVGTVLTFGEGQLKGVCVEIGEQGGRHIEFQYEGIFLEILDELGSMPLPPYITERLEERERYQTVYAKTPGSAAAPTAGLHFTPEILQELTDKGVQIAEVTLHVGLGTFRPMSVENVDEHDMHSEWYELTEENAAVLNATKEKGNRIIAVGTTSCRTLETIARDCDGRFVACSGWTNIFIKPGHEWRAVDALLTNFHLPQSTLLMLVSAAIEREFALSVYEEAIAERYRFFSFGDAMFIKKFQKERRS
ncbi:MAG: tRNA preQ1(34) S-adenosylmethionine ribosyltransferase-isomerase QueA [Bacilli bacterium]